MLQSQSPNALFLVHHFSFFRGRETCMPNKDAPANANGGRGMPEQHISCSSLRFIIQDKLCHDLVGGS